jgi:hypothetical protein
MRTKLSGKAEAAFAAKKALALAAALNEAKVSLASGLQSEGFDGLLCRCRRRHGADAGH